MTTPSFTRVDSVIDTPTYESQKKKTLSDLCDDVLLMICDHLDHRQSCPWKNLSLTNRRLHSLLAPELFKTLHVNAPIKSKQEEALTRHHAHTLKANMFGSLWWWCSGLYVDGSDAADLFRFIRRFEGLRMLEVSMMSRSMDLFEAAFKEEEYAGVFVLPGLEKLVVTSSVAFLARHCPNLKSLVIRDESDCMVEAYTDLSSRFSPPQLKYDEDAFRIETLTSLDAKAIWSANEVQFVTTTFPHLRHLVMRSETYGYRASIPTIMSLLSTNLTHLKTLELSKISHLDMGYRGLWKRAIQECKTAEKRKALWRENERARVGAENVVARLAFRSVKELREVWVGEKRVARRLPVCGEKARWMWEREQENVDELKSWMAYREEREDVVVKREVGT
jgi:hypothetical protein